MITKIDLTETIHTMGETTEEEAAAFCSHLETKLSEEYPDAEIRVKLDNRMSDTVLYAECDTDEEGLPTDMEPVATVREFINLVWERWC